MTETNSNDISRHRLFRSKSKKIMISFFVFAAVAVIVVFWWLKLTGVTLTSEAMCNIEEHIHNEECYLIQEFCSYEANTETPAETHTHDETCLIKELICNKTEHIHSAECFPDITADTENSEDWENSFSSVVLTDNISENLINIARTQVGYKESEENYQFNSDGTKNGYTRYGEWYGNPYGNWDAMFVSFCLNFSGAKDTDALISSSAVTMQQKWQEHNLFTDDSAYTPCQGDIAFIDTDNDSAADSAAITLSCKNEELTLILGDSNDSVEILTINKNKASGYGITSELRIKDNINLSEEATEEITEVSTEEFSTENETEASAEIDGNNPSTDLLSEDERKYEEEKQTYYDSIPDEIKEKIEALPEEDRDVISDIIISIELLPDTEEFFAKMDEFYNNDDVEGEEKYYLTTQENMIRAYALYQGYEKYSDIIFNIDKLLSLKEVYSQFAVQTLTTGTSSAVTFNYFNRGWSAVAPILIYGGSANEIITTGSMPNQYWNGIVVDFDYDTGEYYVSQKYSGGTASSATTVRSLKPSTSKGFVIFIWMADTSATIVQKTAASVAENIEINDRVSISVDPATLSAGYNSGGYGTVTFSEYIPPSEPVEEDLELYKNTAEASDSQVDDGGGKITSADKKVITTKTINGTSEENIFDITLTVQTQTDIQTFLEEPDMAVVIVMDISNTMNAYYPAGQTSTSRYDAAVSAAENFMNQFAQETSGLSKIGFVAFNTHAHEILPLQACTTSNVSSLISEMKTDTKAIIKASGYADSYLRFTNVEAGLKRGYDMLKDSGNANQYIIFLSDGFPTTYLQDNSDDSTNYNGYDPNTSSGTIGADGVFHDDVTGYYCSYGTSYSDKASIKARAMATRIKAAGAKIFSIGVDVGGQTIDGYERTGLSVIDRTSRTYEIGSPSSTSAYTNWLGNSIGSGYYYDSTNSTELASAFSEIFKEIRDLNEQTTKTIWSATDPLPVYGEDSSTIGFIHFFDKDGNAVASPDDPESITGKHEENGENTAYHDDNTIYWDLKKSGYSTTVSGTTTTYLYSLTYRVRLVNENAAFIENKIYETNGDAYLEYRNIVSVNGSQNISDLKYVGFSKPAVHGYVGELGFIKTNDLGTGIAGAEFTLSHDDALCTKCHGDNTAITDNEAHQENYVNEHTLHPIGPYTAVSDTEGCVSFSGIPSGHTYTLTETVTPEGFMTTKNSYSVLVSYDSLTVTETQPDGTTKIWTGENDSIINIPEVFVLPETGGNGTAAFSISGTLILMSAAILLVRKKEKLYHKN